MRQVFLPPFEKAVEAHLAAIMPSYNENDGGVPSSANRWLLRQVLRDECGFKGPTFSDYFAIDQLASVHHAAANKEAAGVLALHAGVDVELPTPAGFANLPQTVGAGKISESELNEAVSRMLTLKFQAGLFEHPYTDPSRAREELGGQEASRLSRKAADEAIVLLKNDKNLLPLDVKRIKTLAVIGPNADQTRLGTYIGIRPHFVSVLAGIRERAGQHIKVVYAEGCRISEPDTSPSRNSFFPYEPPDKTDGVRRIRQAVETARAADVILLVVGGNESVSRESFGNGGGVLPVSYGDADTLELPGDQEELVEQMSKLGKPMVAILLNGKAYAITSLANHASAILEGWYLG